MIQIATTSISARINTIVSKEAHLIAKKRNISFSKLVEVALVHEINRKGIDQGLLSELLDIQEYVSDKIENLSVVSESEVSVEVYDEEYCVNQLKSLHDRSGYVTSEIILEYAEKIGMSYSEFKNLLDDNEYTFIIRNKK